MPRVATAGCVFEMHVVSTKTGERKEEFRDERSGDLYICSEVGEEFTVPVVRRMDDTRSPRIFNVTLRLDGEKAQGQICRPGRSKDMLFSGWRTKGGTFRAFVFGAPSEDAASGDSSKLKIQLEVYEVAQVVTKKKKKKSASKGPTGLSTDDNRVRKPFQPHVSSGRELAKKLKPSRYRFQRVAPSVKVYIRYMTAVGLQTKALISPTTHPRYFRPDAADAADADAAEKEDDNKPEIIDLTV